MTEMLDTIMACPKCGSDSEKGLNVPQLSCATCDTRFFELDGMQCWFAAGLAQKYLWEDLLAKFLDLTAAADRSHLASLAGPDRLPLTQKKLQRQYEVSAASRNAVVKLLRQAGLRPARRQEFADFSPQGLSQYYELMLRDWSWQPLGEAGYRVYEDENRLAFDNILPALASVPEGSIKNVLVIGSGAGRLSWDLHRHIRPQNTVALDRHPLLAYLSRLMIKDQASIELPEMRLYPHHDLGDRHAWQLSCPVAEPELHDSWNVITGDAWAAPFQPGSFDMVVTPWFMDINGRDSRDLIALVERLLRPDGVWLNHGPFLYPDDLPEAHKYTPEELRQLLKMAGFAVEFDRFALEPYTWSPLNQRGRTEEVWTFLARTSHDRSHLQSAAIPEARYQRDNPPAWLVLPHLPVPAFCDSRHFPDSLGNIVQLFDGSRSINDIADIIAPNVPEGHDARQFLYDLFNEYLVR